MTKLRILLHAAWHAARTGEWWGIIDPADFESLRGDGDESESE